MASLLAQMVVPAWRGVLGAFSTESYPHFRAPHPVNYASAVVVEPTSVVSVVGILLAHRDAAARALERLATLDGLTGDFNRRAWTGRDADELAAGQRYEQPLAVLISTSTTSSPSTTRAATKRATARCVWSPVSLRPRCAPAT